ncbi:argininosuccinate synthase domain-containing protein [Actinomycetes bacterium KLBMP 9797]
MRRFVTSLDELLAQPPRHLVLLYSGGLDGTYLLHLLRDAPVTTTAVNVRVGDSAEPSPAATLAARFGAEYREVDATAEFYAESVPAAIHADAYYQGQFPVGSTLTRPLMARAAVRLARGLGADAVGHTATYMQNSAARLGRSVAVLDPDLHVVAPFLGSDVPRDQKREALRGAGVLLPDPVHSVDANPWSRVIENGSLETPENRLDESVFRLTRDPARCPADPVELTLTFEAGLPVGLDGERVALCELVPALNRLAGAHGVGRFTGLEDTPFGPKNHEVRESPAAAVLTAAHRALANAVLDPREHAVRAGLAAEWTTTAVHGGWFSHLGRTLGRCLAELDRPLTGTVDLRLWRAAVTVLRLEAPHGLHYARFGADFHRWMDAYSYDSWHHLVTLADTARSGAGVGRDAHDRTARP